MKTTIISGNFAINIEGEFNESGTIKVGDQEHSIAEVRDQMAGTYLIQRDVLSGVYKELLPKGEKRNSLAYSDDVKAKVAAATEKGLAPYGTFTANVEEHVPSEGGASPMVRATAFVDALSDNGDKEAQMRQLFALQGMTNAADADREALVAFAHKQGLGIQPPTRPGTKKAA